MKKVTASRNFWEMNRYTCDAPETLGARDQIRKIKGCFYVALQSCSDNLKKKKKEKRKREKKEKRQKELSSNVIIRLRIYARLWEV